MEELLRVKNLKTYFKMMGGTVRAVDGVSFSLNRGEALGIAGETGSGKSVTVKSLTRNLPSYAQLSADEITLDGLNLLSMTDRQMQSILGKKISMVFQNPTSFINPLFTVGTQMVDVICCHENISKATALQHAREMLVLVGMPDPDAVLKQYPFQMSGGMIQRVMIALGLSCNPSLLIADEPTTALDVTIQAQILALLGEIKARTGSLILITHNLAIISEICDKIAVMYAGKIVEVGDVQSVMRSPRHPYTKGLLAAIPRLNSEIGRLSFIPGNIPDMMNPPKGCRFSPRCPHACELCRLQAPDMAECGPNHAVACHAVADGRI